MLSNKSIANKKRLGLHFLRNFEKGNHEFALNAVSQYFEKRNLFQISKPGFFERIYNYLYSVFYKNSLKNVYEFENLIKKMMSFEPANRPTINEVIVKLDEIYANQLKNQKEYELKRNNSKLGQNSSNYIDLIAKCKPLKITRAIVNQFFVLEAANGKRNTTKKIFYLI